MTAIMLKEKGTAIAMVRDLRSEGSSGFGSSIFSFCGHCGGGFWWKMACVWIFIWELKRDIDERFFREIVGDNYKDERHRANIGILFLEKI